MRLRRLLVLLWVVGTLAVATRIGSAERTRDLVVPVLRSWGLDFWQAQTVHKVLRKGGHVLAYAGFALLVLWALQGVRGRYGKALAIAAALAILDEVMQHFTPERGASVLDVLLDAGAAALALAWWRWRIGRRAPSAGG